VVQPGEADDSDYIPSAGRCWLISAVARIYQPGCQADNCLILEGAQGTGKSSALKILAGDWFTDHLAALGSKDAAQQLEGAWIVELAELDSMRRSELSATKAFLTCRVDRFRAPYARTVEEHPRQMVFSGSTNESGYLKDDTGNRRFWPVRCGAIDREALIRDRDQLWAEALTLYRAGEPWWFTRSETVRAAVAQQKERLETDAWEGTIHQWVVSPEQRIDQQGHPVSYMDSNADWVTTRDVLVHAIGIEEGRITKANQMVAASVITRLGWCRKMVRRGDRRMWVFENPQGVTTNPQGVTT
jgi:predicted P-loop ATPase